jgi:hypothetical protein
MLEIVDLSTSVAAPCERLRQDDAAAAVAARIEQQHVVIVERTLDPVGVLGRSQPGKSGTALQEGKPGPLVDRLFAVPDGAREDRQRRPKAPGNRVAP